MPDLKPSIGTVIRSLRSAQAGIRDERILAVVRSYLVLLGDAEQHLADRPFSAGDADGSVVLRSGAAVARSIDAAELHVALKHAYMMLQALPGESTWVPPFIPPPPP